MSKPTEEEILAARTTMRRLLHLVPHGTEDAAGARVWDGLCEGLRCFTISVQAVYGTSLWLRCLDQDDA